MRTAGLLFAAALGLWAADEQALLRLAIPNARAYSGIDVLKSRNTPFGRYVLTRMEPDSAELKKFLAAAGFEPGRDLLQILAFSTEDGKTLIAGRGSFQPERFVEAARAQGADVETYQGIQVFSNKAAGSEDSAIAFLDASTAVMGDVAMVHGAIDRGLTGTPVPAAVAEQVQSLASANDAWFLSTGPVAGMFTGKIEDENLKKAVEGGLLGAVLAASGGVRFGAGGVMISADAETKSVKDAAALGDVVKFIASLVQWDTANGGKGSLADSMKLTTEGSRLRLTLSMPEAAAEQLFMQKPSGQPKRRPRRTGGNPTHRTP
jgi:hypothetical protein